MKRSAVRVTLAAIALWATGAESALAENIFQEQVAPILERHCLSCHSGGRPQGDFSLRTAEGMMGAGYVEPGDASSSYLLELVTPVDGQAQMPKDAAPLTADELAAIARWIDAGADWPAELTLEPPRVLDFDWWSYGSLTRPQVPPIDDPWAQSPIDRLVLYELDQRGLTHSAAADRRTLIRRVTYDLTGLPPTAEEVEQFVNDSSPRAYDELVDRLLDSQRYGERWARHWLDVVKYADTHGYDKDKLRPHAWPYRDYVIRSFNEDKPYSRFVQEQVAGDVLFPGEPDGILGLGFLAAGPWDWIGHAEVSESKIDGQVARNLDRDDMVSNTLNTFCSVTVQCARCHHHKFDPITQEHYYGLQSLFAAVDRADRAYDLSPEIEQQSIKLTSRLAELTKQQKAVADQISAGCESADSAPPQALEQRRASLAEAVEKAQAELAALPAGRMVYAAATNFVAQANFKPTAGKLRTIHVLHRGNVQQPLGAATPGLLPLDESQPFTLDPGSGEGRRRAALARWLTGQDHPLVWRSIVNRVWQYHFGRGIVATPNDFGRMGEKPTHPELLDWLAVEFRDGGQSFKSLHRMIVTSNTYRQSSQSNAANARVDGSNRYLWRAHRRRLAAEEIRDSILAVSGALDTTMGGPGFYLFELEKTEHSPHYEYHKFDPADAASHRRSIYRFIVRSQPDPWMSTLDCADSSQSTPRRSETLTSLQALSLLNNRFNLVMSQRFAERIGAGAGDLEARVERAVALALQRRASETERREFAAYAKEHGMANLCRVLFNLSEFVFLD